MRPIDCNLKRVHAKEKQTNTETEIEREGDSKQDI